MLAVSDTGVGIEEATRQRMFEPFYTTKPAGEGTGLGLSMVEGIVAQSGGSIEVSSEPGRGSTFRIYLPVAAEVAAGRVSNGKETVLVVEDQAQVRQYTVAVLRERGYQVVAASSAAEALAVCERGSFPIHLVLTDVVMPHGNGRELAARLAEARPGLKVLFMSGYTDTAVSDGVAEKGAQFIQKPFSPDELAAKIRQVLEAPGPAARVLVADDEAAVRSFLRGVLEAGGYEVVEAAEGREALRKARSERVAVVITDLVMPGREGLETIQSLRRELPAVKIIAISGAFGGRFLESARLLGADAVLDKPVDAELLLSKVAEVL
jgi:CheY-like chemotaxis protein